MGAIRAGDNPQLFATSTPKGKRLIYREWVAERDRTPPPVSCDHVLYRQPVHRR